MADLESVDGTAQELRNPRADLVVNQDPAEITVAPSVGTAHDLLAKGAQSLDAVSVQGSVDLDGGHSSVAMLDQVADGTQSLRGRDGDRRLDPEPDVPGRPRHEHPPRRRSDRTVVIRTQVVQEHPLVGVAGRHVEHSSSRPHRAALRPNPSLVVGADVVEDAHELVASTGTPGRCALVTLPSGLPQASGPALEVTRGSGEQPLEHRGLPQGNVTMEQERTTVRSDTLEHARSGSDVRRSTHPTQRPHTGCQLTIRPLGDRRRQGEFGSSLTGTTGQDQRPGGHRVRHPRPSLRPASGTACQEIDLARGDRIECVGDRGVRGSTIEQMQHRFQGIHARSTSGPTCLQTSGVSPRSEFDPLPLPWAHVETLPAVDPGLVERWRAEEDRARSDHDTIRAGVGLALACYWSRNHHGQSSERIAAASLVERARALDDPTLLATTLLGQLYSTWGPDNHDIRRADVEELLGLADVVTDDEITIRAHEWWVLDALDHGDHGAAVDRIAVHNRLHDRSDLLSRRRRELWFATLDMSAGHIDRALARYHDILPLTSPTTGAPVSFQDGTIASAIDWYFRSQGPELEETVRAILRNDPRVEHSWRAGLAFLLAETGDLDAARAHFDPLVAHGLDAIQRDLNWLVTMWLITFAAADLGDMPALDEASRLLEPFASLDVTLGAGFASYGPVARALARAAVARGDIPTAREHLEFVLDTRSAGPWTELARFDLATIPGLSGRRATELLSSAGAAFDAWGMSPWTTRAAEARIVDAQSRGEPIARLEGSIWHLAFGGEEATLSDGVGTRHLITLIERPHRAVPAVVLDAADISDDDPAGVQDDLDRNATAAYVERLALLQERPETDIAAQREAESLRRALSGGRHRASSSREVEKARVRVTRAIRRAVDFVADTAPGLGAHLDQAISTGRLCSYEPSDGTTWHLVRRPGDTSD